MTCPKCVLKDRVTPIKVVTFIAVVTSFLAAFNCLYELEHKESADTAKDSFAERRRIVLAIGIMSAPHNHERRQILRSTWLSTLKDDVLYYFLTDGPKESLEDGDNNDILILGNKPSDWSHGPPANFEAAFLDIERSLSIRLYRFLQFIDKYSYMYALRVDDDYFVCLAELVHELRLQGELKLFYRGWFHCGIPLRADESFVLISQDLATWIITSPLPLNFGFYGGVQLGKWLSPFNISRWADNARLLHVAEELVFDSNFCKNYVGVHNPAQGITKMWDLVNSSQSGERHGVGIHPKYAMEFCNISVETFQAAV